MQSTPPILGRPDPRRIHSAAEHAKTKATLECFMETTNEGMTELGRQTQLTYNVASHHIGLLEGQVWEAAGDQGRRGCVSKRGRRGG